MRSYPVDAAAEGELVTPTELNAEVAEIVSAMHSIDRYNFAPNILDRQRVATGSWNTLLLDVIETNVEVEHIAKSNQQAMYPIPDGDGNPWVRSYDTPDCMLHCSLGVDWADVSDNLQLYLWIGVLVDGLLVAQSPLGDYSCWRDHAQVWGIVPVAAGTHRIECVYGLHDRALATPRTVNFFHRILSARAVCR